MTSGKEILSHDSWYLEVNKKVQNKQATVEKSYCQIKNHICLLFFWVSSPLHDPWWSSNYSIQLSLHATRQIYESRFVQFLVNTKISLREELLLRSFIFLDVSLSHRCHNRCRSFMWIHQSILKRQQTCIHITIN